MPHPGSRFESEIEKAKQLPGYKNYLETRDAVFQMMENEPKNTFAEPSKYWQEELSGFLYMLDASSLIIKNLRQHCYHLTGIKDWEYRQHHTYHTAHFEQKLKQLQLRDRSGVLVPESPALGGFGHSVGGALYNGDTLRFYDAMLGLDCVGGLEQFRQIEGRKIVAEIGAGWGGFAYQFKTLFPHTSYIIVDFPSTILFSGTYLKTVFPNARVLFLTGSGQSVADPLQYDFIFAPHYAWPSLRFRRPDLLVNLASFQEMRTEQMDEYIRKARDWKIPYIYSVNHERNFSNPEMDAVSGILGKYYALQEVHATSPEHVLPRVQNIYKELKAMVKIMFGRQTKKSKRHLLGTL